MNESLINHAKGYATSCHNRTNHKYDGKPYATHLQMVYDFGLKYSHLVPTEKIESVLSACWTHSYKNLTNN